MELRKGNYYELFSFEKHKHNPNEYRIIEYLGDNKIRYVETNKEILLNKTNSTFANQNANGKQINHFGYRDISILPIHLERLGFKKNKKCNLYEHNCGIKIIYSLSNLGGESEYIGNILLSNEQYNEFINTIIEKVSDEKDRLEKTYSTKIEDIQKLIIEKGNAPYYPFSELQELNIESRLEIHNIIVSIIIDKKYPKLKNINELFLSLENMGITIENKDNILLDKL